jgi:hypothetical protein
MTAAPPALVPTSAAIRPHGRRGDEPPVPDRARDIDLLQQSFPPSTVADRVAGRVL